MIKTLSTVVQEPLPYPENALAPYISSKTLSLHYGKHHRAYVEKTNRLVEVTSFEGSALEEIILETAGRFDKRSLFNNAAQAWNHAFYWKSMRSGGGGHPGRNFLGLIKDSFGGFEEFKQDFETAAVSHFGSGWIWLVREEGLLKITGTHDADNPLVYDQKPLLAFDVWEHAYYLDYQNERGKYANAFLDHLVDWGFAESQLESQTTGTVFKT